MPNRDHRTPMPAERRKAILAARPGTLFERYAIALARCAIGRVLFREAKNADLEAVGR